METPPNINGPLAAAEAYARRGWPIVPLNGKLPAVRNWQAFEATPVKMRYWFGSRRCNIGLRTGESGFIVVDTDTPEAEAWVREHLPATPMRAMSGNGSQHHYYAVPPKKRVGNKQHWKGVPGLDVRGWGGFIVLPGSVHPKTGRRYEWSGDVCDPSSLPVFSPRWVYERRRVVQTAVADVLDPDDLLRRGRMYVAALPKAEEGKNGHTTTFVAAMKIARFVGFNRDLTWQLLLYYNATRCVPPWDVERDLEHKLEEGLKHARR